MHHCVWNIPSVVDNKKNVLVSVIPFNKLIRILNYKNMIFSCLEDLVFVADILNIGLKLMLG